MFLLAQPESDKKISKSLLDAFSQKSKQEFLIVMKDQMDVQWPSELYIKKEDKARRTYQLLKDHALYTQQAVLDMLNKEQKEYRSHFIYNCIYVKADLSMARKAATYNEVESIIDLQQIELQETKMESQSSNTLEIVNTWGVDTIRASKVWEEMNVRGEGAVIGNQDTGVEWEHPGLRPMYRGSLSDSSANHNYSWHDAIHYPEDTTGLNLNPCGYDTKEPCDDHNHGTHTVGTSVGKLQEYCFGVAPGAKWMACRNMDRGVGTPETYIECFEWFMAPTDLNGENPNPSLAPDVINNSWACPESEGCNPSNFQIMESAINNLRSSGVVVVVSAGNSGRSGCASVNTPAAIFESSFTVGAIQQNDTIASFSSIGPVVVDGSGRLKPNVVAPGRSVRSSVRNGEFARFSGTSMAGPHVVGAVALMISANPLIAGQVDTIEAILEETALPRTIGGRDCSPYSGLQEINHIYGHGRIDAFRAVELAMQFDTTVTTSLDEFYPGQNIVFFPNPVDEQLNIMYAEAWSQATIRIYNAMGELMYENQISESLNLSALNSGLYYILINDNESRLSYKFIKK